MVVFFFYNNEGGKNHMKKLMLILMSFLLVACSPGKPKDEELVKPAYKVLSYGSYYYVSELVEVVDGVEILNHDEEILIGALGEIEVIVKIRFEGEEKEIVLKFESMTGMVYIWSIYGERTYVLGEDVDVYQGVYAEFYDEGIVVEIPFELISEIPEFDKIGVYYLTYHAEDEYGRENTYTAPVFIVGDESTEHSSFPLDDIDEFLLPFLDNYLRFRGRPFSELQSDAYYLDAVLAIIMGEGSASQKKGIFYIPIELLQEYAWKYFDYELPDGYCDWMAYDEKADACYNGFEFGFLGGDGPSSTQTYLNREVMEGKESIIVTYTIKTKYWDDEDSYWATYEDVEFELVKDVDGYRIIGFRYLDK